MKTDCFNLYSLPKIIMEAVLDVVNIINFIAWGNPPVWL